MRARACAPRAYWGARKPRNRAGAFPFAEQAPYRILVTAPRSVTSYHAHSQPSTNAPTRRNPAVCRYRRRASGRKPTTIANYGIIARTHLSPAPFGALTMDRLRPSDVEALLVAKREAGLSDSTVRLIYTVARSMLDIAVRDGLVRRNPAAAVSAQRSNGRKPAV